MTLRGMVDGGAEDDGLAVARLLLPVADHLVGDRRAVHDARRPRPCRSPTATRRTVRSCVLHADVDDEGAGRHQMARGDQLAEPDLVGDIVEDLAQALACRPGSAWR